jgi:hypothetical protein
MAILEKFRYAGKVLRRMSRQLAAPEFVVAIFLLLANDFLLKPWLANAFTGKLSDFAGLFAFPFFLAAFLPRWRAPIYLGTALAFTFWKLPMSDAWIGEWNAVSPFDVGRVADASDLMALGVLPLSWWCSARPQQVVEVRWRTVALAGISLFAFAATSYTTAVPFDEAFVFEGSQETLFSRLAEIGITRYDGHAYLPSVPPESFGLEIPSDLCFDTVYAGVTLAVWGSQTEVRLRGMAHRCPRNRKDEENLRQEFISKVAEPLEMKRLVRGSPVPLR